MTASRSFNWPHAVVITAAVVAGAVVISAVIAYVRGHSDFAATMMAAFLACFSILKYAVAARALHELKQAPAHGEDPRELYGTPQRFWIWVVMKNVAATIALVGAIIILVHGANHLH